MALLSAATSTTFSAAAKDRSVTIAFTSDVHGHFYPYDFVNNCPAQGSLSRVAAAIDSLRNLHGKQNLVLLDNGDILQGQPTVYYYNFIDTTSRHIAAEIFDFMGYDAATIGNHDIETGHNVYDRYVAQSPIPMLGANVVDKQTGKPYFKPYHIINRGGLRIAVIGLLTPAIPAWLPERLWSGLEFLPMKETAIKWVDYVRRNENPDIVVGLFHSGRDSSTTTAGFLENESLEIALSVNGFDAILMGHDHQPFCEKVTAPDGRDVWVVNPANNANKIGIVEFTFDNGEQIKSDAHLLDVNKFEPSEDFLDHFKKQRNDVEKFVGQQVSSIESDISTRDAFFGSSSFMTLLHRLQMAISGAEISMAAPLTFDGLIKKGPLNISDMFTLYKYENTLCTLRLTGKEIKDYLEFSYDLWINQMSDTQPHMIRFKSENPTPSDNRLRNASYNFDSASGINYTVDLTATKGNRIKISAMSDGTPFEHDSFYTVAVNSYRAGGGGNHLTTGAGLSPEELKNRQINSTDKDLRFYLIKELQKTPQLHPEIEHNWRFIPEHQAKAGFELDYPILFGEKSSKNQK